MTSQPEEHPSISVSDFLAGAPAQLELKLLAGADGASERVINSSRIQKLGLALAGFTHYIHTGRVQLVGQSEVSYLAQFDSRQRREAIAKLELDKISCVLVSKKLMPPAELVEAAERAALPLIQTALVSSLAISVVTQYLQESLAPRELRHGVLLDIYGLGVLIEGASGVGKSECALDLVMRGHRLVSDDLVDVRRTGAEQLVGSAPELLFEHMEIRGLGILNVRELFGVSAISGAKAIDLNIKLERWDETLEIERLGLDVRTVDILGVSVPSFLLPVSPGRNLATLVETAVRVHLLRARGHDAAQQFVARHAAALIEREASVRPSTVSNMETEEAADDTR